VRQAQLLVQALQVEVLMQALQELLPCLSRAAAAELLQQHWGRQAQLVRQQGQQPAAETAATAAAAAPHHLDQQRLAVLLTELVLLCHWRL
jgi:hypothetical protein